MLLNNIILFKNIAMADLNRFKSTKTRIYTDNFNRRAINNH
jgi:hypothetical protein